ncbi:hypothetical protein NIES4071_46850 [Calothrix sp. NIES-4071]|nr:hypothetical protein NIES4071_46850 [Calothrix sp. NIES-4071]BAZ58996.1 hypothetical protein NIES4105_46780 [Calothrix sp. NIES-4105]
MVCYKKFLNQQKLLLVLGLSAIGIILAPSSASAFTIVNRDNLTDTQFNNLLHTGEYTETFVAESRMGNNQTNGDRELGINNPLLSKGDGTFTPLTIAAEGQRIWKSGELVDFKLEYDGNSVKYTVGGQLLSSDSTFKGGAATDIFLRTFALANTGGTSKLTDLFLNGEAIGKDLISTATSANDLDYIQISGITTPFTLTGKSSFAWTGTTPNNSKLAYQIKVVHSQSVPEPGMVGGMLVAGAMGVANAKRKKQSLTTNLIKHS